MILSCSISWDIRCAVFWLGILLEEDICKGSLGGGWDGEGCLGSFLRGGIDCLYMTTITVATYSV